MALFGKRGIFCGACDRHIGKAKDLAKRIKEIMESQNIDLGSLLLRTDLGSVELLKNM
ncbi:MAG: hypothetical protein ACUVXA_13775 [Candidatus Jordarchaeum sp.]|uniref:hypothetical protein n=1 Tax=Candidatus Jordarchaeum sp. TaxID=2823881 RepID=UPI00404A28CE